MFRHSANPICSRRTNFAIIINLSAFALLILALPPQTMDLYRASVAMQAFESNSLSHLLSSIIGSVVSISLILLFYNIYLTERHFISSNIVHQYAGPTWFSIGVSNAPLAAAIWGIWQADLKSPDISYYKQGYEEYYRSQGYCEEAVFRMAKALLEELQRAPSIIFGVLACLIIVLAISLGIGAYVRINGALLFHHWNGLPRTFTKIVGITAIVTSLVLFFVTALNPVLIGRSLTSFGILAEFVFLLAVIHLVYNMLARHWRRLSLSALVILFIFNVTLFNSDSHQLRTINGENSLSSTGHAKLPNLEGEFFKWFDARSNIGLEKEYPILIVAAEGGGLYAAYHSAAVLAAADDLNSNFGQRIFAISGVSGGSIGASVYTAAANALQSDEITADKHACCAQGDLNCLRKRAISRLNLVREAFQWRDYISPLLSAFFFHDLVQFVLPAFRGNYDRSAAMEEALEQNWAETLNKLENKGVNLGDRYSQFWQPESLKISPALILNSTDVRTGSRLVISPFSFDGNGLRFLPPSYVANIRLSTAAVLSARFPWITPASYIEEVDGSGGRTKTFLVDGGYYENSGVATALDVVAAVEKSILKKIRTTKSKHIFFRRCGNDACKSMKEKVESELARYRAAKIQLVIISSEGFSNSKFFGLSGLLDPIRALLNATSARGGYEIRTAHEKYGVPRGGIRVPIAVNSFVLNGRGTYDLPLAWMLSEQSILLIDASSKCDTSSDGASTKCLHQLVPKSK